MLSTVQAIQYLMIEVLVNNEFEVEVVQLHHLAPYRVSSDYGPVQLQDLSWCSVSSDYPLMQLHHLPASTTSPNYVLVHLHHLTPCRPRFEHATPLYHSVVITALQAVGSSSLTVAQGGLVITVQCATHTFTASITLFTLYVIMLPAE
jgi:hypothetical protein